MKDEAAKTSLPYGRNALRAGEKLEDLLTDILSLAFRGDLGHQEE